MSTVIVLGGCGAVGRVVVKTLAARHDIDKVVVADIDKEQADHLILGMNSDCIEFVKLDVNDANGVVHVISGSDLVVNCVGPFYKTVKTVLSAVIECGINYVDVCDDVDVTLEILNMDAKARQNNVTAMIGMGSSPGATNLLAKFAARSLLDETDSIDIFHAHGGEPIEGKGVIGHRFHCMSIDIPMFLDGQLQYVRYFEPDGVALRQTFDFPVLGKAIPIYPYPHPEQVTLPKYLKLRQVTNKGTVLPNEYYDLIRDMCQLGLADRKPVNVNGQSITPYDFSLAFILNQREKILEKTKFGIQRGCCSVIAKGKKNNEYTEYRFHMASQSQALGEGTGIPAAMGAILMLEGKIDVKGVLPPEGCIDPQDFFNLLPKVMDLDKNKQGGKSFGGVIVECVDAKGNITTLDF